MRHEIATLCYLGRGGFTHDEVLRMSRDDRKFYLDALKRYERERAKSIVDAFGVK